VVGVRGQGLATKAHPGLLVADLESMLRTCHEHGLEIADAEPPDGLSTTPSATGWN